MRRLVSLTCAALVWCSVGCGAAPPVLGPELTGDIPAGVYSGEITFNSRSEHNGVVVDEETSTLPHSRIVDSSGLPLVDGRRPRVNMVIEQNMADVRTRETITAVHVLPSQVVIDADREVRIGDSLMSGSYREIYSFIPPSTLRYEYQYTAVITDPERPGLGTSDASAAGDLSS